MWCRVHSFEKNTCNSWYDIKVLECLSNLDHRGAKFADGTGDGAGVLTEIPYELIRAELLDLDVAVSKSEKME